MGEDRTGHDLDRALTVADAASALGITQDAVRKRIKRGTIQSEKDESGRIYVYVPASETVHKTDQDTSRTRLDSATLTSELRDRLRYVEGQLEAERQAHAEARRIIAGLVERMPAIEASQTSEDAAQDSGEGQATPAPGQGTTPRTDDSRGSEKPWWRRVFGGG
jgi:hypothetical protein